MSAFMPDSQGIDAERRVQPAFRKNLQFQRVMTA
jgi:hypothetical protein